MSATAYPVRVDAKLDAPLSRWLWLAKWLLAIPHYIVLAFLWIAFVVLSAVAFFAILFTGRYPRAIFDFNVGVLRWTWRVQYYAYGALGTDRYPPFSLQDDPAYPARLEIDYPSRLSRGLVLVKWWLLAIPHYIIVGIFAGGGVFAATEVGGKHVNWASGGLIGILVLIAAVVLAVTGRYPDSIFGFVLGMNRWVLRVAAYASLMTDQYPPFRLDAGGSDPSAMIMNGPARPAPTAGGTTTALAEPGAGLAVQEPGQEPGQPAGPPQPPAGRWTGGLIASAVVGSVLLVGATGLLAGGAGSLWADQVMRDGGYVTSASTTYTTGGRALVTGTVRIPGNGVDQLGREIVGKVRIRVTAAERGKPVFVGLARAHDVARYLAGVRYTTIRDIGSAGLGVNTPGARVPADPSSVRFWAASSSGLGTQTVVARITSGNWAVVVMNPDASAGMTVRADVGATAPGLPWIAAGLLATGVLLAVGGALLIVIAVRQSSAPAPRQAGPAR
ncbi:MAG TPA: DUF4389 domain-containing protein [Streptosporangiaceae bacterium]